MTVSVVLPTYNRGNVLDRAIQSVTTQNYEPLEIIIIDGPSTDNTQEVVNSLEHDRVTYIRNDELQGVGHARNQGISESSGEYIFFMDSDDELLDGMLETLVSELESAGEECGCLYGYRRQCNSDGTTHVEKYPERVRYEDFVNGAQIGGFGGKLYPSVIFDEVGHIDTELSASEDDDFHLRMLRHGYDMRCVQSVTYDRYHGEDQLSYDFETWKEAQPYYIQKHADTITRREKSSRIGRVGRLAAEEGEMREARRFFIKATKYDPKHMVNYYNILFSLLGKTGYEYGKQFKGFLKNYSD